MLDRRRLGLSRQCRARTRPGTASGTPGIAAGWRSVDAMMTRNILEEASKTVRASSSPLADRPARDIVVERSASSDLLSRSAVRMSRRESMKSAIVVLFGLTSFLASVLLFSVEPMIGKMVLPVFGGTPAVWNTCLVYFQVMLLCGYLLAHGVDRAEEIEPRRVSMFSLLMLAALLAAGYFLQPIALQADVGRPISSNESPALALLGILCRSAALPLVMVSATAPLVQGWFALTGHPRAHDPYFLYAASNAGSLLALLAYPFVIEPNLGLTAQSRLWRTGFLILAILVLACGVAAWRRGRFDPDIGIGTIRASRRAQSRSLSLATWLRWLILVFIPSSWLMGVTTYLTTDLASIPLIWIIPLALYLLSFILAFAQSTAGVVRAATRVASLLVVPLVLVMSAGFVHVVWIPLHLLAFFVGSVACHGALAQLRPLARHLRARFTSPSPSVVCWAGSSTRSLLRSSSTGWSSIRWRWSWRA